MTFGPFILKAVQTTGDNLVLELANEHGVVLHRPKRKLRYAESEAAKAQADRLTGKWVTTETYDPVKWPASHWWLSLTEYTPPSVEVARHISKVFGPPGTGKTYKLIEDVKEHVKLGVQPGKIAFLTFTNVAADVARERIIAAFPGMSSMDFPHFSTLHSLATRVGGLMNKSIMDMDKLRQFDPSVREETVWMKKGDPSSAEDRPDHLPLAIQSFARARCIGIEEAVEQGQFEGFGSAAFNTALQGFLSVRRGRRVTDVGLPLLKAYLEEYNTFKRRENLADFDDVIDNAQQPAFDQHLPSFDLLIIDEAQDLSDLQWKLVHRLIAKSKRIIVAGDDDQAIMVSFGASPNAFLDLAGETDILQHSKRVPKAVHEYVEKHTLPLLQEQFPNRIEKIWNPVDFEGQIHTEIEKLQRVVNPTDQSSNMVKKSCEINLADLLSMVQSAAGQSWLIMAPTKSTCRRISTGLSELEVPHYHRNEPVLDPKLSASDIRVMSIHTSKGDEADNVALVLASVRDELMLQYEPRLVYVAHTRAKRTLYPFVRLNA